MMRSFDESSSQEELTYIVQLRIGEVSQTHKAHQYLLRQAMTNI